MVCETNKAQYLIKDYQIDVRRSAEIMGNTECRLKELIDDFQQKVSLKSFQTEIYPSPGNSLSLLSIYFSRGKRLDVIRHAILSYNYIEEIAEP